MIKKIVLLGLISLTFNGFSQKKEKKKNKENTVITVQLKDDDKDGVINQFDKEPNTPKGVMVYGNGVSVDSDQDGVPDYQDDCLFAQGPISNQGCPVIIDSDKDGIPDDIDKCNGEKGFEKYQGCATEKQLRDKIVKEVASYSKSIYFDTGSNRISSSYYYTMLDEVANIMLRNENVTFSVTGYTDDRGEEKANIGLSKRRAEAAKKYLIARGIEADRILAVANGEANPKFDNKTDVGRQLNRRVEIKSEGYYEKKTKFILEDVPKDD